MPMELVRTIGVACSLLVGVGVLSLTLTPEDEPNRFPIEDATSASDNTTASYIWNNGSESLQFAGVNAVGLAQPVGSNCIGIWDWSADVQVNGTITSTWNATPPNAELTIELIGFTSRESFTAEQVTGTSPIEIDLSLRTGAGDEDPALFIEHRPPAPVGVVNYDVTTQWELAYTGSNEGDYLTGNCA